MSESKKVLYKRETASKALMELANRLSTLWINGYDVPVDIDDVIIFGSYARGEKRVHDLDVFVSVTEHRELYEDYWYDNKGSAYNPITGPGSVLVECGKYIKGKSKVISLHMDAMATPEEREIATSGVHYYIMKDGELDYDMIDELLMMDTKEE